jgi:cytosine/adenosine deaminase-related metal-dependent hydrolase
MFTEMRTAALLQKALHGPDVFPANRALRMATIDGAAAMGLDAEIGSVESGKRADLSIVRLDRLHTTPYADVISALVYSSEAQDVDTVLIDGRIVMRDRKLQTIDENHTIATANAEYQRLISATDLRR